MRHLKNGWLFLCLMVFGLMASVGSAQIPDTAPEYESGAFDAVTEALLDSGLFLGLVIAICLVVTGFFLGRKWLARVG